MPAARAVPSRSALRPASASCAISTQSNAVFKPKLRMAACVSRPRLRVSGRTNACGGDVTLGDYIENAAYCLRHGIQIGGPLPTL